MERTPDFVVEERRVGRDCRRPARRRRRRRRDNAYARTHPSRRRETPRV